MTDLYKTIQKEYYGDGTRWFIGIVEDNKNDPEKLGRVRVRVYGTHNAYLSEIPTEKLPWATVLVPGTYGGVSGVGRSPTGIEQGAMVFGVFMDGRHSQNLLVLGSIPKIEQEPGKDITPEDKIEPAQIESKLGGTGDTTGAVKIDDDLWGAEYSGGVIMMQKAMEKGYGVMAASSLAAIGSI
tara:strand:- start:285 stop:833 length:549 start_codon:yes stop_codon:yes gene_type:complete